MDRSASLGSNVLRPQKPGGEPSVHTPGGSAESVLESEKALRETHDSNANESPPDPPSKSGGGGFSENKQIILVALVLIFVGIFSWQLYLRRAPEMDVSPLEALPINLGLWSGVDVPMRDGVTEMLEADFNIQRTYVHRIDGFVWFYFGYYGTERGGEPIHTPPYCYESQGWQIVESSTVRLGTESLDANELIVEREGERRLVRFWYQSYSESGMLDSVDRVIGRVKGLLLNGRSDGSLVRLSVPLPDDSELPFARARLSSFAREMSPVLREHWPVEAVLFN